jgi:hypothetical protein
MNSKRKIDTVDKEASLNDGKKFKINEIKPSELQIDETTKVKHSDRSSIYYYTTKHPVELLNNIMPNNFIYTFEQNSQKFDAQLKIAKETILKSSQRPLMPWLVPNIYVSKADCQYLIFNSNGNQKKKTAKHKVTTMALELLYNIVYLYESDDKPLILSLLNHNQSSIEKKEEGLIVLDEGLYKMNPIQLIHLLLPQNLFKYEIDGRCLNDQKLIKVNLIIEKESLLKNVKSIDFYEDNDDKQIIITSFGSTDYLAKLEVTKKALETIFDINFQQQQQQQQQHQQQQEIVNITLPVQYKLKLTETVQLHLKIKFREFSICLVDFLRENLNKLMKKTEKCPTFAAVVQSNYFDSKTAKLICLTTQSKYKNKKKLNDEIPSKSVNDCHAEILATRCLRNYFYQQLEILIDGRLKKETNVESIFQFNESKEQSDPIKLKSGISFNLFISKCPCGAATATVQSNKR